MAAQEKTRAIVAAALPKVRAFVGYNVAEFWVREEVLRLLAGEPPWCSAWRPIVEEAAKEAEANGSSLEGRRGDTDQAPS